MQLALSARDLYVEKHHFLFPSFIRPLIVLQFCPFELVYSFRERVRSSYSTDRISPHNMRFSFLSLPHPIHVHTVLPTYLGTQYIVLYVVSCLVVFRVTSYPPTNFPRAAALDLIRLISSFSDLESTQACKESENEM